MDLINWVALAYTLTYLSCAVLVARISDVVGRRNAFLASFIIFFGFSLGCGFAQNLEQLVAFRALQGLGGSGKSSISIHINRPQAKPAIRIILNHHDHLPRGCPQALASTHLQPHRHGNCQCRRPRTGTWRYPYTLCLLALDFLDQVSGTPVAKQDGELNSTRFTC